jgi:hypothetical protein
MDATCIQGKNNVGSMDGRVGRPSTRLKKEATSRMRHTGKYNLEEKPIHKATTCKI